MKCSWS